ncbi:MAG: hypothetical protein DRQ56_09590 [Gammaproteobacteria bacterium]|nr:MAG: hypothetical protein DRQ56_09590 [Gammaproteobacteria bacterium]
MAKLTEAEITELRDAHKRIMFYGTKKRGYTDSGLWEFLPYVYTKDSHDKENSRKPLLQDDPDYAKIVFLYMLACPNLDIPKSRQVRMSWIATAYAVWSAMNGPDREVIYQTKKEEDAFAMVSEGSKNPTGGRMDFIIQHLPEFLRDPNIISGKGNQVGKLVFSPAKEDASGALIPWYGSKIHALPQGANQVRQYTFSNMISDESAFQEEYESSMIAAQPAATGGGQIISLSSVYSGSAFNRRVLEAPDGRAPTHRVHPTVKKALKILGMKWPKGLRSWPTPAGDWVLEVHYTADPAKDPEREGAAWVAEAVKGYVGGFDSVGWKTEMEIDYEAGGGDPVFPFITSLAHPIFIPEITVREAIQRFNIYAGYDHGMDSPSAYEVWGVDQLGRLYALWELYEPCMNSGVFVDKLKAGPYWDHVIETRCDPKICARDQMGAVGNKSINEQFAALGLHMLPGRRGQDVPMALRLTSEYWSEPMAPKAFITAGCPNLQREIMGLKWQKHVSAVVDQRKNAPGKIMDKNNHAFDATCYILDSRPALWTKPAKARDGLCMNDLLDMADERQRARERPHYGISVA